MAEKISIRERKKQERDAHVQHMHQNHPDLAEADKKLNAYALSIIKKSLGGTTFSVFEADETYQALRQERLQILEKYRLSEDDYEPKWDCPQCQDRGYIRPGVPCVCQRKRRREASYLMSGIPEKY